jgi:hypothetical protein
MNNLAPDIGALRMGLKTQNDDSLENDRNGCTHISVIYSDTLPEWKYIGGNLRKLMVCIQGSPIPNVAFVGISWMDYIFVRYSTTSSDLPSNSRLVMASRI